MAPFATIDASNYYNHPNQLYPDADVYQTMTHLDGARPWGRPKSTGSPFLGSSASSPAMSVRSGSRMGRRDLISPDPSSPVELTLPNTLRLDKELTWITIPGARDNPSLGKPGPGARKGRGAGSYSKLDLRCVPANQGGFDHLATYSSLHATLSPSYSRTLSTIGFERSPSERSLRLDARASERRFTASPGPRSPEARLRAPQSRVPATPPIPGKTPEAWKTVPHIGYGNKFYYRP